MMFPVKPRELGPSPPTTLGEKTTAHHTVISWIHVVVDAFATRSDHARVPSHPHAVQERIMSGGVPRSAHCSP